MLTVGDKLPAFNVTGVVSLEKGKEFKEINQDSYKGQWLVLFFWPKDFTFICPTEIAEFGKRNKDFHDRDAQVLGVSTDSEYVHHAWRTHHPDLKNLPFPMLADIKRELSTSLGVLHKDAGVALRATFIVDPRGHHPARVGERPVRGPQRGRDPAHPGRVPDGRAVPLQLAEG